MMEGRGEFFGNNPGQTTLLQGPLCNSLSCLNFSSGMARSASNGIKKGYTAFSTMFYFILQVASNLKSNLYLAKTILKIPQTICLLLIYPWLMVKDET